MAVPLTAFTVSEKRSLVDLQEDERDERDEPRYSTHEISSIYSQDGETETEEEQDRRLQLEAAELGIDIDQILHQESIQDVPDTVAGVAPTPLVSEPSVSSRFSQSTLPTSCSSSEQQPVTKSSSFSTFSIPSTTPSILSLSSRKSSYLRFKKGFRRISGFRKRKLAIGYPTVIMPLINPKVQTAVQSEPDIVATVVALTKLSVSAGRGGLKDATLVRESYTLDLPVCDPGAIRRSFESGALRMLRAKQLEERNSFTEVQRLQRRESQAKHEIQKTEVMSRYQQLEQRTRDRHHQAMITLEDRHLSAEVDLNRTLELGRQACETRLRHMEAYCNSPMLIQGMPVRKVTDKDFLGLAQQYHVRDSIKSLHDSRINVLRERQAKQVESVLARQKGELADLNEQCRFELVGLEWTFNQTTAEDRLAAEDRKRRLARRWTLAEAIARRRLEVETGEEYAPLTPIAWDED